MASPVKTICCECGDLIRDGRTIDGAVSHGFCERCMSVIMAFINRSDDYDKEHAKTIKTISH